METKKVDVLFVNPPSPDGKVYIRDIDRSGRYSREETIWPQSNLAYLAAAVDDMFSVGLIDCIAERMDWREFEEYLKVRSPSFVVVNVISSLLSNDMKVASLGKKLGARTIAIGPHVTALPEESLEEFPDVEFVIKSEAEESLRELLKAVKYEADLKRVAGIGFRGGKKIVVNKDREPVGDLDTLDFPRHDLLPLDKYKLPIIGKRYTFVMASRGCPYECIFCRSPVMWGRKVRRRSPDNVIGELKFLKKIGVDNIIFHSDTFTVDKEWVIELCKKIIDEGIKMRWITNSRVDTIDKETAKWMKKAGCWMVALGLESGSQKVLDNAKKGITLEQSERAVRIFKSAGIKVWGYFIIGLPGETKKTVQETIDFSKRLPLDLANFAVGAPYPGTEFFDLVKKKRWLQSEKWEDFDQNYSAIVSYDDFTSDDVREGIRKAYKEWYFRPKQVLKVITTIRSPSDLKVLFVTAMKHLSLIRGKGE